LIIVIVPAVIVGAIVVYLNRPADPEARIGARALGLLAVYVTHAMVWTGLGLAVSARARSQSTAIVVLLALWFANAFVMPPVAMAIAKTVTPSPSAIEFAAAIDDEKASWPDWDQRVEHVMERFLEGEFESSMAPANVEVVALIESEAEETALFDRHFAGLFDTYAAQARTYERAAIVSPTLAARTLSMTLAGTDELHDRAFAAAAARYRAEMLATLNSELAASGRLNSFDYVRGRDLWEKVPPFDYDVPGAGWALSARRLSVIVLGVWLVAVSVAAAWGVSSMRLE